MATRLHEPINDQRDRTYEVARDRLGSSGPSWSEPMSAEAASEDGRDVRTCTLCGAHVPFLIDPLGSWAECTVCGRLN
jgi:hypothetical protein